MATKLPRKDGPPVHCSACPIRRITLFKQVPIEKLKSTELYRSGQLVLPARNHLYHEGAHHEYVYTLFDGCVKLYKTLQNGKIQAMRFASPGDFLGFQGDLSLSMHHAAQAVTDCVLCRFPREQISHMLCEHPEIATELIFKNARVMAFCQEHLLSAGVRSARESIAFTLVELHYRLRLLKQLRSDSSVLGAEGIPITQEDLADAVGITPIHANRTLRQMCENGLIVCGKSRIAVLDEEALADVAHFDPHSDQNFDVC